MGYIGRGSNTQVLSENSGNILPKFKNVSSSGAITQVKMQVFTGSGTYTPTSGMVYCIIECLGGGGAGGGANATTSTQGSVGGGGGAGEYARGVFSATNIGASQTITIGAGGTGVAAGTGNNGGTTSIGSLMTANGGTGATATAASSIPVTAMNGEGGTGGTGGSFRTDGMISSMRGFSDLSDSPLVEASAGANSQYGSGGDAGGSPSDGDNATGYGAGGGGAANGLTSAGTYKGGNGSSGLVIITEFIAV
jgi:hypothetical protein